MSTTRRLISGTAASWIRIIVTIAAQIIFVPVYLTHWSVDMYGTWLAVQALLTLLTIAEFGHQNYLEFEFLKIGNKPQEIAKNLWSGVVIALGLGLLMTILIVIAVWVGLINVLFDDSSISPQLASDAGKVLIIISIVNTLVTSAGGVFVRALAPFGHFSRMTWWGVWLALGTTCAPVIAVVMGAGFLQTGFVLGIATIFVNIPLWLDVFRLLKREKIHAKTVSLQLGFRNFIKSLVISLKDLLDNFRQQGIRVILLPIVGTTGLTVFSTTRTGANLALQGLNTITNPLMPELMRFLNARDQKKMEVSFGTIWFIVIALLGPGMILLQTFIGPFFDMWTKGKIAFNSLLFATLSLNVLIYAYAQPAIAVIRGNNILKPQITISAISAACLILGLFILVPYTGLVGAGLALMISELVACIGYFSVAKKWLNTNGLHWPVGGALLAGTAVAITSAILIAIVYLPEYKLWISLCGMIALGWNTFQYYYSLPLFFKERVKHIATKLRIKKLQSVK